MKNTMTSHSVRLREMIEASNLARGEMTSIIISHERRVQIIEEIAQEYGRSSTLTAKMKKNHGFLFRSHQFHTGLVWVDFFEPSAKTMFIIRYGIETIDELVERAMLARAYF